MAPSVPIAGVKIKQGAGEGADRALKVPKETEEWVLRVVVKGDSIKCYFFPRKDLKKLDDPAPTKPIIEAKDASNSKGCVGIRNDTIVGTVDDFAVYGEAGLAGLAGLAVDAREKLAITWGEMKGVK